MGVMTQDDIFINAKDTLYALIEPRRKELEHAIKKGKVTSKGKTGEKVEKGSHNRGREEAPSKGLGFQIDQSTLAIQKDDC